MDAKVYTVAIQLLHKPWLEGRGYTRRLLHFKLNQTKPNRFHYSYKADIQRVLPLYCKTFFILPHLYRAFLELVLSPPGPGKMAALWPQEPQKTNK